MGKNLAIRGHLTRGKEVIELLEMMGGCSPVETYGLYENRCYLINDKGWIVWDYIGHEEIDKYDIFTLEEFLEKYPFKIGDKVHIYVQNDDIDGRCDIETAEITSMRWNPARCKIAYKMKDINREFYKEEIKCKVVDSNKSTRVMEEKDKAKAPDLKGEDYSGKRFGYKIPDGYEFDVVVDGKIFLTPIMPKYPETYKECCGILGMTYDYPDIKMVSIDECNLYTSFIELIRCRNAYWKIAGEEMGLGKTWKPAVQDTIWGITRSKDEVEKYSCHYGKTNPLEFPTEEMRNIFYENFKDLIEKCKTLL